MCGIAGLVGGMAEGNSETIVRGMLDAMAHRGPDDSGFWRATGQGVAFGHLRLSIIDLSPGGHQPMSSPDGRYVISYNGEIYNFQQVRNELSELGHRFRSKSDTEVMLASYAEWGIECLQKFRGMFAFALYDRDAGRVTLVRDRAGVKPLYYHRTTTGLAFSSELRGLQTLDSFLPRLDPTAIRQYLQFGRVENPNSIYESARAVRPGHYLIIENDGRIEESCYWDAARVFDNHHETLSPQAPSIDEYATELAGVLAEAFALRQVADVPVGLFLSGGVDSSLLASVLAASNGTNLKTYTIGFTDPEFDEAPQAKLIADYLGTQHTEEYIDDSSVFDAAEHIFEIIDEPIGDNSVIPTYFVSRMARQSVKVAMSADGGDELFAGYSRYRFFASYIKHRAAHPTLTKLAGGSLNKLSPALIAKFYRLLAGKRNAPAALEDKVIKMRRAFSTPDLIAAYRALTSEWHGADLKSVFPASEEAVGSGDARPRLNEELDPVQRLMYEDFTGYMVDDVLTKVDRASMAVSLEAREPFLDNKLVEFAAKLPVEHKLSNGVTKIILRKLLGEHLPAHLIQARKQGFAMPVGRWLKGPLKPLLLDTLSESSLASTGVFAGAAVTHFTAGFLNGKSITSQQIWYLMQFELWRKANCPSYSL